MMRANPELNGGVFDLPHIVTAADLYVLKYILHDWDDANCVRIVQNCRAHLAQGGRIAVIETQSTT
ncbi:methyltransferase [Streptomyces sp. ActVer]|uniref:methyltransferase n=1 Tax=Streptomyces sp. ActVer TaxID=3014558 RepID=UPI0022B565DB|nr:methyltransferase [Streptomyces sp. ActVer]MCZ4507731.1 methyltransferase [Streptomyces sp. ActVer]